MSDYFGALMNLSGLGGRARAAIAPAHGAAAGGDIVESESVRVAPAAPAAQPHVAEPAPLPIAKGAAPENAAIKSAAIESAAAANVGARLAMPADATADSQPAQRAVAGPVTELAPAAALAAPMAAEPQAIVRAALKWVAGDPHTIADRREIAQQVIGAPRAPAAATTTRMSQPGTVAIEKTEIVGIDAAPRMQVAPRDPGADLATEAIRAPAQNVTPAARIVAGEPAAPGRVAPATVADEIVEISIGAISVRVDAPVLQALPAPPRPARIPSERPAAVSALSRRALRRF